MPSKKIYVKPYEVKGHWRTIRTRNFKFICSFCDEKVERQSYATACPRYGNRCQGKKQNCLRNINRTGVPSIPPLPDSQSITPNTLKTNRDDESELATAATAISRIDEVQEVENKLNLNLVVEGEETKPTSARPSSTDAIELRDKDRALLIDYIKELLEKTYNKSLTVDESFVLSELLDKRSNKEMATRRKTKVQTIERILSNLMKMLSDAFGEEIELQNFHFVMQKHFRAIQLLHSTGKKLSK